MTKRAFGRFERAMGDFYPTPLEAVIPVVPYLRKDGIHTFAEPCCGDRSLIDHFEQAGFVCVAESDLRHGLDARSWTPKDFNGADAVLTNPPWKPPIMSEIMEHQSTFRPAWFLIYWDWLANLSSGRLIEAKVTDVVPLGRVRWIPDTESVGFDNSCWIRMAPDKEPLTPAHLWARR